MKEIETICPYTGLRSFTEDESLYFKGRDEQILKVTSQLQEKKFLMVTGASGDGKSSLIFAGVIPQARAGFFKSRFSNWQVADFRPERSPIKNMANALSSSLQLDAETIEVELGRGFSSLVELYKASSRYTDHESSAWKDGNEEEQAKMERGAGNLLILIDQFEEFFTNPENFPGGVPSQESRLLLNIILETAKISLKEDLPIYIVCTMRSDYIGQCAAFRGLPEFIGFSQFFVPRLQRKELYEVIEEPAVLSGNRISKRLVERLIVDVEEGTDQLPILQHALKEIWKKADNGREEMDLIHYAMVGGMNGTNLPKESLDQFKTWRNQLPDQEKNYLNDPGLANVLDIHANKLYGGAVEYCRKHGYPNLTSSEVQFIIGMSFACLTRIDENRAVRNRMTLNEITQIINVPKFNTNIVSTVLSIFRQSENTLVRPFIDTDDNSKEIDPETVLDITHEALIRNWKLLKTWADKEFEYYNTFLDFQLQVKRWKDNGKSADFLLPIGPLSYFENWYKNCRPNQYWINRYNTREEIKEKRLSQSAQLLKDGKDFLRKSSFRLLISRTFMKYGAGRIALMAGTAIVVLLSIVSAYIWTTRQNDVVLDKILKEGETLLSDRELQVFAQTAFISQAEHHKPGYFKEVSKKLQEEQRIKVGLNFIFSFAVKGLKDSPPIVRESLFWTDSLVHNFGIRMDSTKSKILVEQLNYLISNVRNLSLYNRLIPDLEIETLLRHNATYQSDLVMKILSQPNQKEDVDMKTLNVGLTDALNFGLFPAEKRNSLIKHFSPFNEDTESRENFNTWFPKKQSITAGVGSNFSHNGGYQTLAYLYASLGDAKKTLRCIDSLRANQSNYDRVEINSTHVAIYFLLYGHDKAFEEFVVENAGELQIPVNAFLYQILNRIGAVSLDNALKFFRDAVNINSIYSFVEDSIRVKVSKLENQYIVKESKTEDELNFNIALHHKLDGVLTSKSDHEKGIKKSVRGDSLFNLAMFHYNRVSQTYLDAQIEVLVQDMAFSSEKRIFPRSHLFMYPDFMKIVIPTMAMSTFTYYSDDFFLYLLKKNLYSSLYKSQQEYELITQWISQYFHWYGTTGNRGFLQYPMEPVTFNKIDSLVENSGYDVENAWVKMKLAMDYFEEGDTTNAYFHASTIRIKVFAKKFFPESVYFQNMMVGLASEMAKRNKRNIAISMINNFSNNKNRIVAYSAAASACQMANNFSEAKVYFDSAMTQMSRLKNFAFQDDDFRLTVVKFLGLRNTSQSKKEAFDHIGSMLWFDRDEGIYNLAQSYAFLDNYYEAWTLLPEFSSSLDRAIVDLIILQNEASKKSVPEWADFDKKDKMDNNYVFTQNDLIQD